MLKKGRFVMGLGRRSIKGTELPDTQVFYFVEEKGKGWGVFYRAGRGGKPEPKANCDPTLQVQWKRGG